MGFPADGGTFVGGGRAVGFESDGMKGIRVAVREEDGLKFLFMLVVGRVVAPRARFSHGEIGWLVANDGVPSWR